MPDESTVTPPVSEDASGSPSIAEVGDTAQGGDSADSEGGEQGWEVVGPRSPRRTTSNSGRRFGRMPSGMTWAFTPGPSQTSALQTT